MDWPKLNSSIAVSIIASIIISLPFNKCDLNLLSPKALYIEKYLSISGTLLMILFLLFKDFSINLMSLSYLKYPKGTLHNTYYIFLKFICFI